VHPLGQTKTASTQIYYYNAQTCWSWLLFHRHGKNKTWSTVDTVVDCCVSSHLLPPPKWPILCRVGR